MHLGICFPYEPEAGGFAQYSLTVAGALRDRPADFAEDRITVFTPDVRSARALNFPAGIVLEPWPPGSAFAQVARRMLGDGVVAKGARRLRDAWRRGASPPDPDASAHNAMAERWWRDRGVDLLYFPIWCPLAVETSVPFVIGILDLEHRLQPHFPEVESRWDLYEYIVRHSARRATLVITESNAGKQDLLDFYSAHGLTADRIAVVPLTAPPHVGAQASPAEIVQVRERHALPPRYLFYPARFWPHKNHARIVEAIGQLKARRHLEVPLVLAGSRADPLNERTFGELMKTAARMDVKAQVLYLGSARDEDIAALYGAAAALAMPTFFGPSNIPPIEAWMLGCPVITSDLRGIRDMCAGAALLVDPGSPEAIAEAIERVWTDAALVRDLVRRGYERAAHFSSEQFHRRMWDALRVARARL